MAEIIYLLDREKMKQVIAHCDSCEVTLKQCLKESEARLIRWEPQSCPLCGCAIFYKLGGCQ